MHLYKWKMRGLTTSLLLTVALMFLAVADGQTRQGGQGTRQALQDASTLRCEFRLMATGTWQPDGSATGEVKAAVLRLTFTSIDTQDGIAEVAGSVGAPRIIVQMQGPYLHFMQVGLTGFLYTTTVFDRVTSAGRYKAVHTRHEYTEVALPGFTSRPQQYYGDCALVGPVAPQ